MAQNKELELLQGRLAIALEAAAMGTWEVDLDTFEVKCDRTTEALFGYEAGTFPGTQFAVISRTHPDDAPKILAERERSIRTRTPFFLEYRVNWPDGSVHWLRSTGRALYDENGRAYRMSGVALDVTDEKRDELRLKESENRFKQLASFMPQIVWITDMLGRVEYINDRWYDYTGTPRGEISGASWKAATHPDDLERVLAAQSEALRIQGPFEVEYRVRRHDGVYRWHLARTLPVAEEGSQSFKRIGTATDIHDQKLAEETQKFLSRASETLVSSLEMSSRLESSARLAVEFFGGWCAIYLQEEDGSIRLSAVSNLDPAKEAKIWEVERAFPYKPDDPYGPPLVIRTGVSTYSEEIDQAQIAERLPEGGFREIILGMKLRSAMTLPLLTDRGTFGAVVIATSDRSYSKQDFETAQELARKMAWAIENARLYRDQAKAHALLDTLLNTAPVGLAFYDLDLRYVHLNQKLAEINGVPVERMIGKKTVEIVPHVAPYIVPMLKQVLESGEPNLNQELQLETPVGTGKERSWLVSYYPVKSSEIGKETLIGVGVVTMEITQQKEAQHKLEEAVRARDEFLSIASHELKTPLTSLSLQLQLRQRTLAKGKIEAFAPEKMKAMFASDLRQFHRLNRLIDDMLDISRIRTGKLSLQPESFDLSAMVREVTERFAESFQAARCAVTLQADAPVEGVWDRFRTEQVFVNLLTNAMKYGGGKPVHIRTGLRGDTGYFSVRDEGMGISPENHERIFGRFERAVSSDEISGLGLGLFIVREIVKAHGGRILLESSPGAGSAFTVELPIRPAQRV